MPHEILQDLYFIERGFLNGNHFVYRSAAPILIDTGYKSDFEETKQLINKLDVKLASVGLIINTHTHCDHIGGNKFIQDVSGCDIALHAVGKHFIDSRDDWATWWRYFNQEADFFTCTTSLTDGDVISIGPYEFRVIYTPGHAADGIALYNEQAKILISSDALWERDLPVINLRVEGSRALFDVQESLNKLDALDVKMVYPGHGAPFADIKAAIAASRRKVERFMWDRDKLGIAVLKKMIVYTLLLKKSVTEDLFLGQLMSSNWFRENVDFYFGRNYEEKYHAVMDEFYQRGIVKRQNGQLVTSVKP